LTENNNLIGFLDETGVLADDPNQRFFGLGLLKLNDTSKLYSELWKLKNKAESKVADYRSTRFVVPEKSFEFKFSKINNTNFDFYINLLKIYFNIPGIRFSAFIVDKCSEYKKNSKPNVWDSYINFSCNLLRNSINYNEKIFVVADYFSKPNYSKKFWEKEVNKIPRVFNAIMLESCSTLFLQLTDILIGAVAYDYKITRQGLKSNNSKLELVKFIRKKLGINSLLGNFKKEQPSHFNVRDHIIKNASHQLS
jgi:hypothetical protein